MNGDIEYCISRLVQVLASDPVIRAIGLSGGSRPYPKPGEGDIDIFLYAAEIPDTGQRKKNLASLEGGFTQVEVGKMEGGHWGQVDRLFINGVETWLMYFTVGEARTELSSILNGEHLGRSDDEYYPIGRCASWNGMRILYDPDRLLASIQDTLTKYPESLSRVMVIHHIQALRDLEDLERAAQRNDVLFFHFALDLAMDHFLLALFSLNKEFFPSRKRSGIYIQDFSVRPAQCELRMLQVIEQASKTETLSQALETWKHLAGELEMLANSEKRYWS